LPKKVFRSWFERSAGADLLEIDPHDITDCHFSGRDCGNRFQPRAMLAHRFGQPLLTSKLVFRLL
jgi:hypothetical protein